MCVLAEEKLYSDEFDNVDIQTIFNNKGLIEDYYNCFMETGQCKTPQQRFFTGISVRLPNDFLYLVTNSLVAFTKYRNSS